MANNYKKITSFPKNRDNPFQKGLIEHVDKGVRKIFSTSKNADMIIDGDTGELKGHAVFARRVTVDKAQFAKIFVSSTSTFMDLSKTGIKVLMYIISILPQDRDYILFDLEEAMKATKYKSEKSIITGLGELLSCGFLARSNNHYKYFINPVIAFNGNRLTLINDYRIKQEAQVMNLTEESKKMLNSNNDF